MKVELTYHYDVPSEQLIATLTDKGYYESRYRMNQPASQGRFDTWDESDTGLTIGIVKEVPINLDKLPAALKPFLSSSMDLTLDMLWIDCGRAHRADKATADCRMHLGKAPLKIDGRMKISDQQGKAQQVWQLTLSCSVPLVGKKLLEKAAPKVRKLLDGEYQAVSDYLAAQ